MSEEEEEEEEEGPVSHLGLRRVLPCNKMGEIRTLCRHLRDSTETEAAAQRLFKNFNHILAAIIP